MNTPNSRCRKGDKRCVVSTSIIIFFVFLLNAYGQTYPPDISVSSINWGNYQIPTNVPNYLQPFTDPVTNNTVTRISDESVFGCDCSELRHRYAKNQPWNADGTLIMTDGSPSKILDGNTYQVLYESNTKALWSNTEPNYTYDAAANSAFVKKNIVTGVTTTLRTFSNYSSISVGNNEGNLSNDDRYVALIGTSGANKTVIIYDILNDNIISTRSLGTANIDWVSVSQSGNFVVISGYADGSGPNQGIKSYDKFMNNERHLYNGRPHGDIGYDAQGNEVYVAYQGINGYSLSYARLDNGVKQGLFPYTGANGDRGLWGGHISTRNINRPGWAYVSEQGHPSDINRYEATREIFAIKLDNSQTIERFAKHNSNLNANAAYNHQAHGVPNRDGTRVIFASNWDDTNLKNNSYPLLWVVESPQSESGITATRLLKISICNGSSTTLTATGGSTYLWSTGATTASISVSPTTTTTYTVTAYDATGANSDTDEVTVTVNAIPVANAGADVSTCQGTSVTLSALGGSSYLWSTGATTQTINVNPNSTTTYSVQVTQNGCSSSDTVTVTVNPSPTINAGSDVTINLGESTTLTATGGNTYLWSTGSTSSSITVSPTVTTTYTVTGYLNGCESTDTVTVFLVDNSVTANAGPDVSICNSSSTTLTATGGSTYLWSTGATTASISVSPTTTTSYTVTAYDATGTNSDTDDVTVTVNAIPVANAGADVSTCQGTSVTLSASGGSSYLWSTGATTQTINVNPNSTTTYSVQVTQNGCSSSDTVTVTVNPSPTINAGSDVTINLGESTTLTATGGNTYLWSTGSTSSSITVSPTVTTTYTVTGYLNGCQNTDSVTVFVNSANANAGQDQTICNGYSATLTATGGDTYLWSTGATTQSITVNPTSTSTYTVTAYVGNSQDTDSVIVTVNPNPNVVIANGSEVSILEGEYVTLSVSGANTYLWNNGATQPNIAVSPNTSTTYSVTGYINNCSDTKQVTVNVFESVSANAGEDVTVCLDDNTVTLTAAASSGGDQFLWSTGETTSSIIVSPEVDTEYTVTVYNELDYDTDEVMVFVNDCIDTEVPDDSESLAFLVYPNPTFGDLNIKITGLLNVSSIHLYDLSGKALYSETISDGEEHTYIKTLNLSNFAAGIYLLKLVDNRNVITKKIVLR